MNYKTLLLTLILVVCLSSLAFGDVKISGVYFDGYLVGEPEEAIQLTNTDAENAADIAGWAISDEFGPSVGRDIVFPAGASIPAGGSIWVAREADDFADEFGFSPDYEAVETDAGVPNVTIADGWPTIPTTMDIISLKNASDVTVDVVCYNNDDTSPDTLEKDEIPEGQWTGDAVMCKNLTWLYGFEGQILWRDRETDGTLDPDSNDATDFDASACEVSLSDDAVRRVVYVGQAGVEDCGFTKLYAKTANYKVETCVGPDLNHDFTIGTINSANSTLDIDIYHLTHSKIYDAIKTQMDAGVVVTVLGEGSEPGGLSMNKRAIAREIDGHENGSCYFITSADEDDIHDRYRYDHSKMIIADDKIVQIGSENYGSTGQPENESYGNRGWQVRITGDDAVADDAVDQICEVFAETVDPANHKDIVKYSDAATVLTTDPYTTDTDIVTTSATNSDYKLVKTAPTVVNGSMSIQPVFSPDNCLNDDGQIGLLGSATSEILIQQANLKTYWGSGTDAYCTTTTTPSLLLEKALSMASENVSVKVIADDAFFNVMPDDPRNNEVSVAYINEHDYCEAKLFHDELRGNENTGPLTKTHNKGVIVDGQKVLVCSINWVENSFKGNREAGVIIDNSDVAGFYRDVFLNDWYGPSLPDDLAADGLDVMADGGNISPALVITEVMNNPLDEDQDEYVEIFNNSNEAIDVYNFIIYDGDATDYLIALAGYGAQSTTVIPAGGYAIIHDSEYTGYYDASIPSGAIRLTCKNTTIGDGLTGTDPITLKDASGDVIDAWLTPDLPSNGYSKERKADGTWVDGPEAGTPGDLNENNKP
jgi:phosphatidylserine/phosphatidylglycerophosphate/cardiolipin synthase-like enzyme